MVANWEDGRIKMLLTTLGLRLRREWPDVFLSGRYLPLVTDVTVPAGLVGFARILDERAALFIAPRMTAPLIGRDGGTSRSAARPGRRRESSCRQSSTAARSATTSPAQTSVPTAAGGDEWMFAGQVFDRVPVGIVTTDVGQVRDSVRT